MSVLNITAVTELPIKLSRVYTYDDWHYRGSLRLCMCGASFNFRDQKYFFYNNCFISVVSPMI